MNLHGHTFWNIQTTWRHHIPLYVSCILILIYSSPKTYYHLYLNFFHKEKRFNLMKSLKITFETGQTIKYSHQELLFWLQGMIFRCVEQCKMFKSVSVKKEREKNNKKCRAICLTLTFESGSLLYVLLWNHELQPFRWLLLLLI